MPMSAVQLLINAFAKPGDVFTDAPEVRASVVAAENLTALARRLSDGSAGLCIEGELFADGMFVGPVTADISGYLRMRDEVADVGRGAYAECARWHFRPKGCAEVLIVEAVDRPYDELCEWVISGTEEFCDFVLAQLGAS